MPGLQTFTVGFDREGYSEIDLAAATATALGVKSMPYVITAEEFFDQVNAAHGRGALVWSLASQRSAHCHVEDAAG